MKTINNAQNTAYRVLDIEATLKNVQAKVPHYVLNRKANLASQRDRLRGACAMFGAEVVYKK